MAAAPRRLQASHFAIERRRRLPTSSTRASARDRRLWRQTTSLKATAWQQAIAAFALTLGHKRVFQLVGVAVDVVEDVAQCVDHFWLLIAALQAENRRGGSRVRTIFCYVI